MKKLMKKVEDIVVVITLAEAGEYDTAKGILNVKEDVTVTGSEEEAKAVPQTP